MYDNVSHGLWRADVIDFRGTTASARLWKYEETGFLCALTGQLLGTPSLLGQTGATSSIWRHGQPVRHFLGPINNVGDYGHFKWKVPVWQIITSARTDGFLVPSVNFSLWKKIAFLILNAFQMRKSQSWGHDNFQLLKYSNKPSVK